MDGVHHQRSAGRLASSAVQVVASIAARAFVVLLRRAAEGWSGRLQKGGSRLNLIGQEAGSLVLLQYQTRHPEGPPFWHANSATHRFDRK